MLKYSFIILLLFFILKIFFVDTVSSNFFRTGTFLRLDSILFGFILAHFKKKLVEKRIFILFSSVSLFFVYILSFNFFMENSSVNFTNIIFIYFLQFLSAFVLFSFLYLEKTIENIKIRGFCLLISRQTYSIYLIHIIFIYILDRFEISKLGSILVFIISLFISSSLIYKFFEKPFLLIRPKLK